MEQTINNNKVKYVNYCVATFAKQYGMSSLEAFNYLERFGGLAFLDECYAAEHLLSVEDAVQDLVTICRNNGGMLG
ncbi:DUF3791 domain-containing protein [Bacteroides sp. GD17]|uniref:DUF3791 domain-containing protein n=1 Tax=Bacteroides sp. GD17 TaxID=3139826 RepID=UPI0025D97221|nr:DUF3791 domain-containing protein [uncultured Bacteroides sp.]